MVRRHKVLLPILLVTLAAERLPAPTVIEPDSLIPLPASAANVRLPGFNWRVHQLAGEAQPDQLTRLENQLAGRLGRNIALPGAVGGADGPAIVSADPSQPIEFTVSSFINFDLEGRSSGRFRGDTLIPGIRQIEGEANSIAAEATCWINLPEGVYAFAVNSDDGFNLQLGGRAPGDVLGLSIAQFDGGRNAEESIAEFQIVKGGLYPLRLTWEQGTGAASIELFQWQGAIDGKSNPILLNDRLDRGLATFRDVLPGNHLAHVASAFPRPDDPHVVDASELRVNVVDGDSAQVVDPATLFLSVNHQVVKATVSKTGNVTTVVYVPDPPLRPGFVYEIELGFFFTSGEGLHQFWEFRLAPIVRPNLKARPDRSQPGFLWTVFQNAQQPEPTLDRALRALSGQLVDDQGRPLPNLANPFQVGPATGPGSSLGPAANAPLRFEIPGVINLSQQAGQDHGAFPGDHGMPGIPGTTGGGDGIAAEILTWLELPAGWVELEVASDDGFQMLAVSANDPSQEVLLGEFPYEGAAHTVVPFEVIEAGVYPIRILWFEATGDASLEVFSYNQHGEPVLLNDLAQGGLPAFRAAANAPSPPSIQIQLGGDGSHLVVTVTTDAGTEVTLQGSTDLMHWTPVDSAVSNLPTVTFKVPLIGQSPLFLRASSP